MDDAQSGSALPNESRFSPDQSIALRSVRDYGKHGRAVGFAVAGYVIGDGDGDVVAVATPPGSEMRTRRGAGSGPNQRLVLPDDWDGTHDRRAWTGPTVVRVHRAGDPWSVWRWHDGDAWVGDWYGNLEAPWMRTTRGFDTQDWILDLLCSGAPGTSSWAVHYKDEDELEWSLAVGAVSSEEVERTREAGRQLSAIARNAEWPFNADWDAWVPNSLLPVAMLPAGWKHID